MYKPRWINQLIYIAVSFALALGTASCAQAEGTRPRVWIDSPSDGAAFPSGAIVTVVSHAYAREGVAEVVLSINGEAYRRDTPSSPGTEYVQVNQDWQAAGDGIYAVEIVAYDTQGQASNPETITIKVAGTSPMTVGGCPTPIGGGPTPVSCPTLVAETPVSTDTSTPPPPAGTTIQFWAEPPQIQAGACTTIRWHVENAQRAIFGGIDQPFDGSYQTCLCGNERYTLKVIRQDGTEEQRSVDIDVNGVCETPTIPPPPQDTTSPPVPSPAVPANGLALSCRSSQSLAWLPVNDPSGISAYYVKLDQQISVGKWQSVGGYGPVAGKQVDVNVSCGGIYRWTVRAQDGAGNYSDWSAFSNFSINLE